MSYCKFCIYTHPVIQNLQYDINNINVINFNVYTVIHKFKLNAKIYEKSQTVILWFTFHIPLVYIHMYVHVNVCTWMAMKYNNIGQCRWREQKPRSRYGQRVGIVSSIKNTLSLSSFKPHDYGRCSSSHDKNTSCLGMTA